MNDIQIVRNVYSNATALFDYDYECAWSSILEDHDEDGLAVGKTLGCGQTQQDAWRDAAKKVMANITDISVTSIGVQIVRQNPGNFLSKHKQCEPGDPLWAFLVDLVAKEFIDITELVGKKLVCVDIAKTESQFSFR